MSCLDHAICLKLNALWQPIGFISPKRAFISMCGAPDGTPPAMALDVTLDEDGRLLSAIPVAWESWVKLPVRPSEPSIATKTGHVRVPLILLDGNYNKMPKKRRKLTSRAILERDGFRCAYTGEKLPVGRLNVDHVIPKDRGGKDTWTNMVASSRDVNFKKGNKLNSEAGLKLLIDPREPGAAPICSFIKEGKHPHHVPFIQT